MTNAEKYLKDGVSIEEFAKSIMTWYFGNYAKANDFARIKNWTEHKIESLTEDEKVILRNIDKNYTHISRTYGDIWVGMGEETADSECKRVCVFNHLFQFIKERRRIPDRGVIERRIEMIRYFCDKCGKMSGKDELHQVYPDLMSRKHIDLCEDCFQKYSKEMQEYIDNISKAENERQEAIKKYFALMDTYDEQE